MANSFHSARGRGRVNILAFPHRIFLCLLQKVLYLTMACGEAAACGRHASPSSHPPLPLQAGFSHQRARQGVYTAQPAHVCV